MQTKEFASGLELLVHLAGWDLVALMCAEAVPWRCHRSLIADALTVRGIEVQHIMGVGKLRVHTLPPWAHVAGYIVSYPADPTASLPVA